MLVPGRISARARRKPAKNKRYRARSIDAKPEKACPKKIINKLLVFYGLKQALYSFSVMVIYLEQIYEHIKTLTICILSEAYRGAKQ